MRTLIGLTVASVILLGGCTVLTRICKTLEAIESKMLLPMPVTELLPVQIPSQPDMR